MIVPFTCQGCRVEQQFDSEKVTVLTNYTGGGSGPFPRKAVFECALCGKTNSVSIAPEERAPDAGEGSGSGPEPGSSAAGLGGAG